MDLAPLSSMSEEQRQSQYLADVNLDNQERTIRNVDDLEPSTQETRNRWNVNQVNIHEQIFPFSDNLTTLMFIVASDLSQAQRKRLTSSLSLRRMNVPAYTLEAIRTRFLELFCTPKSSMENPSLRVSGYSGSSKRTFIVEDFSEK